MSTLREAIKFISSCSDLDEIKVIIQAAIDRRNQLGRANVAVIRPGDRVRFRCKDGTYVHGTFNRRLTKNVEVKVPGGGTWRVSPQFIERDDG